MRLPRKSGLRIMDYGLGRSKGDRHAPLAMT